MLKMLGIDVTEFNPKLYYVQMSYARNIGTWNLFAVMFFGPFFNTIIFMMIIFITFLVKCINRRAKCRCNIPSLLYKVFATYGIVNIIDFLMVLIVELIIMGIQNREIVVQGRESWVPDCFLLYFGYREINYSLVGILLTVFVFFTITAINIILFCVYVISFHMNGRLRDIYNRLAGD